MVPSQRIPTDATERSVVAVVSEHGADDHVIATAVETARALGVPLIFYVQGATRRWGTVRPTFWSADVPATATLLSALDLERCGEHPSALLVARANAAGVVAYGVLAPRRGTGGFMTTAARQHAEAVVVDSHDTAFTAVLSEWTRTPNEGALVLTSH